MRGALALSLALVLAACGGRGPTPPGEPRRPGLAIRSLPSRPSLSLVEREGDPRPALALSVATGLGSSETSALGSVLEARVTAAGLDAELLLGRGSFHLRAHVDARSARPLLEALARAMSTPIQHGSPELGRAKARESALRRHALEARELSGVAACTGELALVPGEPTLDPASVEGARRLEALRAEVLTSSRVALGAVGPHAFIEEVIEGLRATEGWPAAGTKAPPLLTKDAGAGFGAYPLAHHSSRAAKLDLAVTVPSAARAVSAAEHLGRPSGELAARLAALPGRWTLERATGVAWQRGGCVALSLRASEVGGEDLAPRELARALVVAEREIEAAAQREHDAGEPLRRVLAASDARDAASQAAWWALAGDGEGPSVKAVALGVGTSTKGPSARAVDVGALTRRVEQERARLASEPPALEQRAAIERGQGGVWVALGSPCAPATESASQWGAAALVALGAPARDDDVTLEPWIAADGVGLIAHATPRDAHERPGALAERVARAAAKAWLGGRPTRDAAARARALAVTELERVWGPSGVFQGPVVAALSADRPGELEPFGSLDHALSLSVERAGETQERLALSPLRAAVLVNDDAEQVREVTRTLGRFIAPGREPVPPGGPCPGPDTFLPKRGGRTDVRLAKGAPFAEAMLALPLPAAGTADRAAADVLVHLLGDADRGLLSAARRRSMLGLGLGARVVGGGRRAALLLRLTAAPDVLPGALADVRKVVLELGRTKVTEAELARATRELEEARLTQRATPRGRVIDLFLGRPATAPEPPTLARVHAVAASVLTEAALVELSAQPE